MAVRVSCNEVGRFVMYVLPDQLHELHEDTGLAIGTLVRS